MLLEILAKRLTYNRRVVEHARNIWLQQNDIAPGLGALVVLTAYCSGQISFRDHEIFGFFKTLAHTVDALQPKPHVPR
jgi:hypothetical protein